jgi:hypothetical protein
MAGILGGEHGHLPPEKGRDELRTVAPEVDAEPKAGHGEQHGEEKKHPRNGYVRPEAVQSPIGRCRQARDQKAYRPFGEYGQAQPKPCHCSGAVFFPGRGRTGCRAVAHADEGQKAQEDEEVEPGVDDAASEVELRQDGAHIGQGPKQAEQPAPQVPSDAEQRHQGDDAAQGVRQARGKFVHAEGRHAQGL